MFAKKYEGLPRHTKHHIKPTEYLKTGTKFLKIPQKGGFFYF